MQNEHQKRPADEVAPGTEQTGEVACQQCGGTGKVAGKPCPDCEGTGLVTVNVGDA